MALVNVAMRNLKDSLQKRQDGVDVTAVEEKQEEKNRAGIGRRPEGGRPEDSGMFLEVPKVAGGY